MTEKVIELKETPKEPIQEVKEVTTAESDYRVIEAKPVTKLTEEERALIINSLKEGKPQPNFALREMKGGGTKIIKAINKYPNLQVPQKAVDVNIAQNEQPKITTAKFTNEQMLIQQVMDLNNKMDSMMKKHKKLKKKYKKMKNDIYVDMDELETKPETNNTNENKADDEDVQEEQPQQQQQQYEQPIYNIPRLPQRGWRSNLVYL